MLRLLKYLVVLTLLFVIALPVVLAVAGLQPEPLVPRSAKLTAGDIQRAKLLIEKYDPRGQGAGEVRNLVVSESDLGLLLNYSVAQHFLISAGVAAAGGSSLADAVGLFKEVDDSRGGSGFSFTDLAADRAGVRFAEAATGSSAEKVQYVLAEGAPESVFMLEARDLPEFMAEADFKRRFGGVGAPEYERVANEIEERIAALEIHR